MVRPDSAKLDEPRLSRKQSTMKTMKPILLAALAACISGGVHAQLTVRPSRDNAGVLRDATIVIPAIRREMRAAWAATVFNIDWPSTSSLSSSQEQAEIVSLLDMAKAANLNAIFLQVRSQCDRLYGQPTDVNVPNEPWPSLLTGSMGTAPNPLYDPLQVWVNECRARGIELHVWFNPYRALSSAAGQPGVPTNHITKQLPNEWVTYSSQCWMDPSSPQALDWTRKVILDVVNRYDVDGVVFDDYFYPSGSSSTTNPFPDSARYTAYQNAEIAAGRTPLSLANWRRSNVNNLVSDLGSRIRAIKPWVKFGIGPNGIYISGQPSGTSGQSAYNELYADTRLWLNAGWVDYLAPQIYWTLGSTSQPHGTILDWWRQQVSTTPSLRRHVWVSNYTSNIGTSAAWTAAEIANQITYARNTVTTTNLASGQVCTGNVHYSLKAFKNDQGGVRTLLTGGLYAQASLPPSYPWLDAVAPTNPSVSYSKNTAAATQTISWTPTGTEAPNRYVIATLIGTAWSYRTVPATQLSLTLPIKSASGALKVFGVAAVDRANNMSGWVQGVLDPSAVGGNIRDVSDEG